MFRTLVCALVGSALCAGALLAGEVKGKVKAIDADKHTLTVTSEDGQDHVFTLSNDAKIVSSKGKGLKEGLKDKHLKQGTAVVVSCEKKDGKEVCTQVKLAEGKKKNK